VSRQDSLRPFFPEVEGTSGSKDFSKHSGPIPPVLSVVDLTKWPASPNAMTVLTWILKNQESQQSFHSSRGPPFFGTRIDTVLRTGSNVLQRTMPPKIISDGCQLFVLVRSRGACINARVGERKGRVIAHSFYVLCRLRGLAARVLTGAVESQSADPGLLEKAKLAGIPNAFLQLPGRRPRPHLTTWWRPN